MIDPAPLIELGRALGVSTQELAAADTLEGQYHADLSPDLGGDEQIVAALAAAVAAYGDDLTVTINIDDPRAASGRDDLLTVVGAVDADAVRAALADVRVAADPRFRVVLYKAPIVEESGAVARPVLFPATLLAALARLDTLDGILDREGPTCYVLHDVDVCEVGDFLSIVGGTYRDVRPDALESRRPMALARQADARDGGGAADPLPHWLHPAHLLTERRHPGDDAAAGVARLLSSGVRALAASWLAERSALNLTTGTVVAVFRSAERTLELMLAPDDPHHDWDRAAMTALVEWTYAHAGEDTSLAADRLPLVRSVVVAQSLDVPEAERGTHFGASAKVIHEAALWRWQALANPRSAALIGEIRAAENLVTGTVDGLIDQVATLTKTVTDSVLGGIGTLLASVIAAAFASSFNSDLFRFTVRLYAAYLIVVPGFLGLLSAGVRARRANHTYSFGLKRLKATVPNDRWREMGTERVDSARRELWIAIGVAAVIYVAAAVALLYAADVVPDLRKPDMRGSVAVPLVSLDGSAELAPWDFRTPGIPGTSPSCSAGRLTWRSRARGIENPTASLGISSCGVSLGSERARGCALPSTLVASCVAQPPFMTRFATSGASSERAGSRCRWTADRVSKTRGFAAL